jgi:hypothetical protein
MRFFLLLFAILMAVSAAAQEKTKMSIRDYETRLQARLTTLAVGDRKDTVLNKMGGVQIVRVRGLGVKDEFAYPYRSDLFTLDGGKEVEVLWYKVWEKEKATRYTYSYEPILFEQGLMRGKGIRFVQTYATDKDIDLQLP